MKEIYNFFVRVEVLLLGVAIYLCNTVVVITVTQLLLTLKFGFMLSAGLNPVWGVVEMYDTDNLAQWHQLEIRLNVFFLSIIHFTKAISNHHYCSRRIVVSKKLKNSFSC